MTNVVYIKDLTPDRRMASRLFCMFLIMFIYLSFCCLLFFVPLNANYRANAERMPVNIAKINDLTYLHKYLLVNYYLINLTIGVISKRNHISVQRFYLLMLLLYSQ